MSQSRWQDIAASGPWTSFVLRLPASGVLRLERALGKAMYLLQTGKQSRKLKRRFAEMLKVTGIASSPQQLLRAYCENLPLRMNARLLVSRASTKELARLLRVEGLEHIQEALTMGNGAVIVGTHHGTGPVAAAYLARLGHRVLTVRRAQLSRYANTARGSRTFFGTEALFVDREETPAALLKRGLEALRRNSVISFLGDGDYGSRVQPLNLFGHVTQMRVGMIEVARLVGAPVIPAFGRAEAAGVTVTFHAPIDVRGTEGVQRFAQEFSKIYEGVITADPSAVRWNRFHRRIFLDAAESNDTSGEHDLEDF